MMHVTEWCKIDRTTSTPKSVCAIVVEKSKGLWSGNLFLTRKSKVPKDQVPRNKQEKATTSALNNPRMQFKIATINLCLGLNSKKNLIKETTLYEKIDLLCN